MAKNPKRNKTRVMLTVAVRYEVKILLLSLLGLLFDIPGHNALMDKNKEKHTTGLKKGHYFACGRGAMAGGLCPPGSDVPALSIFYLLFFAFLKKENTFAVRFIKIVLVL